MARRSKDARLRAAAIAGILVTSAGCSGASDKESAEEAGTDRKPSATAPSRSQSTPASPSPMPSAESGSEACGGTDFDPEDVLPWNPQGPAYTGGGTHSVMLFKGGPDYYDTEPDSEYEDEPQLPDKWASQGDPELIVCESVEEVSEGPPLITCEYESLGGDGSVSTRVPVYWASYGYRVLEGRTGRVVDAFALDGSASPWDSCPVEQDDIADADVAYQHVSSRDLTKRLRPLAEGPADD